MAVNSWGSDNESDPEVALRDPPQTGDARVDCKQEEECPSSDASAKSVLQVVDHEVALDTSCPVDVCHGDAESDDDGWRKRHASGTRHRCPPAQSPE